MDDQQNNPPAGGPVPGQSQDPMGQPFVPPAEPVVPEPIQPVSEPAQPFVPTPAEPVVEPVMPEPAQPFVPTPAPVVPEPTDNGSMAGGQGVV